MQLGIGPHLEDADLEQYSMGTLPEARLEPFEEHFLACDSCQDRLLEMEAYVNAVRSVSPKLRKARRPWWRELLTGRRPIWVAAMALALMLVVGIGYVRIAETRQPEDLVAVALYSSRGIEGLAAAHAPAGKPLSLRIDLTELQPFPSYRLEIVDSVGRQVWRTVALPRDGKIGQATKGLSGGQYYVRLYAPGGELLREFGLRAR